MHHQPIHGFLLALIVVGIPACQRTTTPDNAATKRPAKEQQTKPEVKAAEPKTDHERLQGAWQAVKSERAGSPFHITAVWLFEGNQVTTKEGFRSTQLATSAGTFSLDPERDPKTLDLDMEDGKYACIYAFEDDRLRVCFDESGGRPQEFSTVSPTSVVHVFKRQ